MYEIVIPYDKMETEWVIVILLAIAAVWLMWFRKDRCRETEDEAFTTGFGVTSGLTYYNRTLRCRDDDPYGSRSPYCESVGPVIH